MVSRKSFLVPENPVFRVHIPKKKQTANVRIVERKQGYMLHNFCLTVTSQLVAKNLLIEGIKSANFIEFANLNKQVHIV